MAYKKPVIILLSTDTLHHRYFIKYLEDKNINFFKYIFETSSIKPKFVTGPFYEKEEYKFELKKFFFKFSKNLNNKKLINVTNINSKKSLKILKKIKPDIGIVFGCRKLSKGIIDSFSLNVLNIHRGIIKKYRGLDSDLWAIINDDFNNIGTCIHQVYEKLDSGPVLMEKKIKLKKKMKIFHLRYFTTLLAAKMLYSLFKKKFFKKNIGIKQKKIGNYFSFMPLKKKFLAKKKFDMYINLLKQ